MSIRSDKVRLTLKKAVSEIIKIEHNFDYLVSVSDLDISPDLSNAKIYISVLGGQESKEKVIEELNDNSFNIKKGETIKFEVINAGELVHEFNIANAMMHIKHQPEMEKMVENEILLGDKIDKDKMQKMAAMDKSMGHSHSNSVLLAPKEKGILIWKFENAINCLLYTSPSPRDRG